MNIKMSPLRAAKALYSLVQLVRDPNRLGEVFEMADALAVPEALDEMVRKLASENAVVEKALDERHRFAIDLAKLRKLPEGTLGRVFADKMTAAGLEPGALPDLPAHDRTSFLRAHLYETHDVWHTVTGFGMDCWGEIGLQAFYLAQIGGGLATLLLAVGFLRVSLYEVEQGRNMMDGVVKGYEMGKRAKPFFGVHWDELWDVPLDEVRRRLGVEALSEDEAATAVARLAA
jgi:ubiquinone biosynthesis protein Coq4